LRDVVALVPAVKHKRTFTAALSHTLLSTKTLRYLSNRLTEKLAFWFGYVLQEGPGCSWRLECLVNSAKKSRTIKLPLAHLPTNR
ncbi:MAG: hypothetical protein LPK06_02105, partial [Marinobacter sp.]|nr:hypothetical protein [Marinobacter sp.]